MCLYNEESKISSKLDYTGKVYKFDISKGRHNGLLLEEIIRRSGGRFKATNGQSDFVWLGPSAKPDELYDLLKAKNKIINRYPNVKELCRKDTFSEMMQIMCDINPDVFEFVPPSFVFPQERPLWEEY